ncbi:MAG: autoinducer binding domain-containing protein [Alphaproteobacteria bacterium]|nr:autoinducer binding domain-containing protein [Alphaproteobacteria bacterium]
MKSDNGAEDKTESLRTASEEFEKIGISYFSYGLVSRGEVVTSIFSNEEWGRRYRKNHYEKMDPLVLGVVYSSFPLIIWDALHACGKEKKLMMERYEICDVKSGLTLGIKNRESTEVLAVGSTRSPQEFYNLLSDEGFLKKVYTIIRKFYVVHTEISPCLPSGETK